MATKSLGEMKTDLNKKVRTHELKLRIGIGQTGGYANAAAAEAEIEAIRVAEVAIWNVYGWAQNKLVTSL